MNHPVYFDYVPDVSGVAEQGLGDAPSGPRIDRAVGTLRPITPEKDKADTPSLACTENGCFLAWHGEKTPGGGGAYVAFVDGKNGQKIWNKRFAMQGGRPSVATSSDGNARIAWYENGRVRFAALGRDGVGPSSLVARIAGDQPRPSITRGANDHDWAVAWLDFEAGHLEPYAARISCP